MQAFRTLLSREIRIAIRQRHQLLNPVLFFILVCLIFPLSMTPDPTLLLQISPGIIWTAVLLASLMSVGHLFRSEYDDGTLELMLISDRPLVVLVLTKLLVHWLVSIFPLIVLTPLIAMALGIPLHVQGVLLMTLCIGTPVLILIGGVVATLTLVVPQNGMLLALLLLPLYVPVLIFATGAVHESVARGMAIPGSLYILASLLALGLTFAPLAIIAGLKTGVSQ